MDKTYQIASGGIQGGYQGAKFQIRLLQLFAIRALRKEWEFEIWTEDEIADKFDDLLFKYSNGGETRYTFLQAKHKVIEKTFELSTLFADKNFNLYKYYSSFEQIGANFNFSIDYKEVDDLIISTNNIFQVSNVSDDICVCSERPALLTISRYSLKTFETTIYF